MRETLFIKTTHPDRYGLLKDKAREMRSRMTLAEEYLWNEIRAKRLGVTFRRQHPIGDYIADFACLACKLVIEVDGGVHQEPEQKEHDTIRTLDLERLGYRVIRFTNEEVLTALPDVVSRIRNYLTNNSI
ncbi:MAG: endonuclease domain-containing protein [Bacteroidaceae bacterium]|nr:endonuclease domain-containing protein [Bacteroidaceae bacterium]